VIEICYVLQRMSIQIISGLDDLMYFCSHTALHIFPSIFSVTRVTYDFEAADDKIYKSRFPQ